MFYDLNVPWTVNHLELQRTLSFLAELDYNIIALNHILSGKLPANLTCAIPSPLPFTPPPRLRILTRCTIILSDPSQNHRLNTLSSIYDILALRPTTEKALLQACQNLDCALISLDLSIRYPFHFKGKTLMNAVSRGVRIELCYAAGFLPDATEGNGMARRNVIQNATAIIRATRGRGVIISSEAKRALACRSPWDVINVATIWGLSQERGREAVGREARAVVVQAEMKKSSFRGVVDVVYGGEKPVPHEKVPKAPKEGKGKRKADTMEEKSLGAGAGAGEDGEKEDDEPISRREMKRRAKKARLEAGGGSGDAEDHGGAKDSTNMNGKVNSEANNNNNDDGDNDANATAKKDGDVDKDEDLLQTPAKDAKGGSPSPGTIKPSAPAPKGSSKNNPKNNSKNNNTHQGKQSKQGKSKANQMGKK
ncbi:MAG: hypothetical protein MMC33_002409 [Icmadophila ericetorum]|nr:hypothetical protein [Icmadophila ericetorum]